MGIYPVAPCGVFLYSGAPSWRGFVLHADVLRLAFRRRDPPFVRLSDLRPKKLAHFEGAGFKTVLETYL